MHYPFVAPQLKAYETSTTYQNIDQYGLYVQDQIKLPYHIHVMGGIRYQYLYQVAVTKDYLNVDSNSSAFSDDAVTPRVGLLWQPQSWLSVYGNYVESFGANQAGLIYVDKQTAKPIPSTGAGQYEIGAKTEFFDGRLRATLAYYDLTKTNIAVADPNKSHRCAGGLCYALISEARSKGPELDIQGEILPGWQVITTFANTDVKATQSVDGIIRSGQQFFGIPVNTASFWSTYNFQSEWLRGLTLGGGVSYQSPQLASIDENDPKKASKIFKVAEFETIGLMAGYSRDVGDAKVSVQFNVENLLDERYFTGFSVENSYGAKGEAYGVYGTPRTFMGSINIQY